MSVSINVAIRCRPFVVDDALGVFMEQKADDPPQGEVELLNSKYTTKRFGFTYSWWSAFGWDRHLTGKGGKGDPSENDTEAAKAMKLIDQKAMYKACGEKIEKDVLDGNTVVLFAYGLSGSGKTFSVFGPDAPDLPEAWFKHSEEHDLWGVFPRLAYNIFKKKTDGWKITMKYFQNVVDTVRDLMSPMAKEQNYKKGMHKDKDGFMDIDWCEKHVLDSWDDLRKKFEESNARKAISATQFNHQSTRGHCIMVLEVTFPDPENPALKKLGRVYVCDLAGTEPAGDIVAAKYKKKLYPDGQIEHEYLGPDPDQSKTKELQSQGKKINLSLSEMAQFFMKMANAVKKKTLKPGKTIPGCNSYFLCKFLKDTMLQSKTYLFCAIRPEVKYLNYTFATLGFAKNASVIKVQPKKAQVKMSAKEKALMAQLEELKAQMANQTGGMDEGEMQRLLAEKQAEMKAALEGDLNKKRKEENEKKKKMYADRGISLVLGNETITDPYLINLDEDGFRNKRFMYVFSKKETVFGKREGDVKPFDLHVVDGHCHFKKHKSGSVYLNGGNGSVFHNGEKVTKDSEKRKLKQNDRLVIGHELLLFKIPGHEDKEGETEKSAREAQEEYQQGIAQNDNKMLEQTKKLEEDKLKLMKQLEAMKKAGADEEELKRQKEKMEIWRAIDMEMLQCVPLMNEITETCRLVARDMLEFKLSLQQPKDLAPQVKIQVTDKSTSIQTFLDRFEVQAILNELNDHVAEVQSATAQQEVCEPDYEVINSIFDKTFQFGTCTNFVLHTALLMETDEEDICVDITKSVIPYDKVGTLEIQWDPRTSYEDSSSPDELDDPDALLGKSWCYEVKLGWVRNLSIPVAECQVSFEFNGERYNFPPVNPGSRTRDVNINASQIITVENCDEEFLEYLDKAELKFEVNVKPWVSCSLPKLSNTNAEVMKRLGLVPLGSSNDGDSNNVAFLKKEIASLNKELELLREEKYEDAWKVRLTALNERIAQLESERGTSKTRGKLEDAKATDAMLSKE